MKAVAVIPARMGSRRLPRKNLADLAGRPLLVWTIQAALDSGCFQSVVVSSDSEDVRDLVGGWGEPVRYENRDVSLALDDVSAQAVVLELVNRPEWKRNGFDRACLLQPTSPFRTGTQMRDSLALLTPDCDSVVSVCRYPMAPEIALRFESDRLEPVFPGSPLRGGKTQSQDLSVAWHPNGAIYWAWIDSLVRDGTYFAGRMKGFPMNRTDSCDIDSFEDLESARHLARRLQMQTVPG